MSRNSNRDGKLSYKDNKNKTDSSFKFNSEAEQKEMGHLGERLLSLPLSHSAFRTDLEVLRSQANLRTEDNEPMDRTIRVLVLSNFILAIVVLTLICLSGHIIPTHDSLHPILQRFLDNLPLSFLTVGWPAGFWLIGSALLFRREKKTAIVLTGTCYLWGGIFAAIHLTMVET
ncbi:hypothetical protein M501DRAFT_1000712 [Patellaria atrata CBS 101060]|uniref:Uncharacterized protein n=1 Tax=Patellaria atrata CBS 101060 TaxID=1346257 RepID=A0A9P4SFA7_9PEZI|nr:hypothetical protein M501DRAFT_1000712 [Patellaria atrata CBS 101060]